jgi:hypothetical protein
LLQPRHAAAGLIAVASASTAAIATALLLLVLLTPYCTCSYYHRSHQQPAFKALPSFKMQRQHSYRATFKAYLCKNICECATAINAEMKISTHEVCSIASNKCILLLGSTTHCG